MELLILGTYPLSKVSIIQELKVGGSVGGGGGGGGGGGVKSMSKSGPSPHEHIIIEKAILKTIRNNTLFFFIFRLLSKKLIT
jgi:hypothetical protein